MRRSVFYLVAILILALSSNAVCGENVAQGVRVVVIDAGHGGPKFPGARYNGVSEKDINLQVALKLGALIERNMPDVKVVYTRKVEKQFSSVLTDDLQARADIANKANGDLFISIHANAARDSGVRGVETLIMGESPMETRVNENILFANNKDEFLDMSDQKTAAIVRAYIQNLQFTYGEYSEMMARLVQKHYVKLGKVNRGVRKQPLKVLYATDMPSVLTEIGFMSNPQELKYITSEKGQNEIAAALFGAVKEYSEYVRKSLLIESSSETDKSDSGVAQKSIGTSDTKSPSVGGRSYSIQIMASADRLKSGDARFGAYRNKVKEYRAGGKFPYKYCVGEYADRAKAQAELKSVRKAFSTAFVVAVENGAIVTGK